MNRFSVVKDKQGNVFVKEEEWMIRWVEYFYEVLNRDVFVEILDFDNVEFQQLIQMKKGKIIVGEIVLVIKQIKGNKVLGEDCVIVDMFKVDLYFSVQMFVKLFN